MPSLTLNVWASEKTDSKKAKTAKSTKMTNAEYSKKAKYIWKHFVPNRGQSNYVQGELLRAVAKIRREAQNTGYGNWDKGFEILVQYLRKTILNSHVLQGARLKQFKKDIKTMMDYPYTEEDLYIRMNHAVVDFYMKYPTPIKHKHNPALHR